MSEYTCNVCNTKFDEEEKKLTNDEHKCILHCEKDSWYKKTATSKNSNYKEYESYFWIKFKNYIDIQNERRCEVRKIQFPKYRGISFDKEKHNYEELFFTGCTFTHYLDFISELQYKNLTFRKCIFNRPIKFERYVIEHNFLFEECTVHENIVFYNMQFKGFTSFIATTFKKGIDFVHVKFYDLALFNNCKIENIKLENTFFMDGFNFSNLKNNKEGQLESENIFDRETARIIKDSFEKQNNIIEANKYYAIEMEKREEELDQTKKDNWFELLVFKIHGWSSNHSQDWLLALFWIINIGLIASIFNFYSMQDENLNYIHSNLDSLYISVYLIIATIFTSYCLTYNNKIFHTVLFIGFYLTYRFISTDNYLTEFANVINPFSIMTKGETLNLGMLIFKVIIAYLIYQFVVSVRQNTRRK